MMHICKKRVGNQITYTYHFGFPTYLVLGCLLAWVFDMTLNDPMTIVFIMFWPIVLIIKLLVLTFWVALCLIPIGMIIIAYNEYDKKERQKVWLKRKNQKCSGRLMI